ncbi:FIGNL1-interacting regulator of recombination and mitosis isoform X2 [Myotis daubentonii]|uniref:FIGNL1-interacting regulator of recombination and mitosis isoform X2 n=1 Tax=Myotis daubentonii TaxID=98922 RepID=UPI002872F02E|nr:FIGNL1-interacting regulator of recombination and mitosis isoform X2 [Myotis daubentonii]
MSQEGAVSASAVPLEELSSWPEELCRRELPTVLPRLLSMYQHSDSWIEHIQILKTIVQMFLPHMNHLTLEQTFFSQVLPKTVKLFDDMMYELTSQARELTSQNLEIQTTLRNILQTMVQVLGALTGCVQHVCATQEPIILENIQSLPSSVLHVIRSTFVHCKNSESVYSGRLHLVSDLLQALFKEAYSLQKQLMELLDMVCMDPGVDENDDILNMVLVIHSLLDICSVISSMDHAFHANTWKFIIKQSLKHQSVIKSQLRHKEIITSLCEDILCSFQSCLQLAEQMAQSRAQDTADNRLFQKILKLCRFLANSLLHYTKEFLPFLSDSCCTLHQLYLQIHSKFPPSLYAAGISQAQQEEIAGTFLITLDPLITQLLTFQPFMNVVLDSKLELPCELQFPQCLLLVVIMDKLPSQPLEVQTLWCTESRVSGAASRVSLLKAIFCSFEQCSGELSLPVRLQGVEGKGHVEVAVPLYQHVCVHLCAFITAFHPSLFPELDAALLSAVLGANMIASLLAMDAWCFLARYGTAELCAHHVTIVAHLIKSCPGECHQLTNLSILLRRLFFFMAPPHQVEFIQKFAPKEAENLPLWQHISFQAFPAELRKQTAHEVVRAGTAQSRRWLGGSRTVGELEWLNTALSALLAVNNSASEALDIGQQTALMEAGSQLWAFLNTNLVTGQPYVQRTLSLLFPLLGFFIQTLDPQLISQVVTLQASLLKLEPPDHVRLAVLDFVSSLGKLFISPAIQDKIVPNLCSIFALLLADRNWLLEQHALEAFTQFAEGTSNEEIVPQCLSSEETKNKVVSFLEKTGFADETVAARVERVKQEKGIFWGSLATVTSEEAKWSSSQPCAKRARHEPPVEEEYRSALQAAAGALEAIESLLQTSPAPDWLPTEMQLLQEKMDELRRRGLQDET